jgi:hypothetical protein
MAQKEAAFSSQHSAVSQKEALSSQHSAISQDQNQDQKQEQRQNLLTPEQQAEALALKLARTYEELSRLLERNPGVKREITQGTTKEDKVYQKLKQRLKLADMAPRCQWVRQDGTSCGSPQMKQHIYCFAHMQMAEARELMLRLPPPEDANAIQVGLMRIQKAVIEDTISMKKAGLLLYSMQLALTNVGQTTFGQAKDEEMVRETVDEEEAFSEKQNQHQHQRPFTTEGTENTEEIGASGHRDIGTSEHQNLPRMDADERGLENSRNPIEWKPTPDMYRTDTPEGREAYEASFQMKIKPRVAGEPRPLQGLAQPGAPLPQNQERFTAKDAEDAKEIGGWLGQTHAKVGCDGMHREGVGGDRVIR